MDDDALAPEHLTPEQEEVRRLLAGARHDEPMPESVVARLDRVLADLAEEPVRDAPVVGLAARRRRATQLLVAAAAVIAVGIGVDQLVGNDESVTSAETTSDRDEPAAAEQESADSSGAETGSEAPGQADAQAPADGVTVRRGVVELDREAYADDVTALREQAATLDMLGNLDSAYAAGVACRSDSWGEGTFVPVRYDGAPAVLVFRKASGDTQVADLYRCGDRRPHRSVTLPAP